jgi:hypothetical protein
MIRVNQTMVKNVHNAIAGNSGRVLNRPLFLQKEKHVLLPM